MSTDAPPEAPSISTSMHAVRAHTTASPDPHHERRWLGAVITGALIRGGTRFHQEAGQPEPLDEIVGGLI